MTEERAMVMSTGQNLGLGTTQKRLFPWRPGGSGLSPPHQRAWVLVIDMHLTHGDQWRTEAL